MVRAHPRSRGENPMGLTTEEAGKGSSPLTRGKLLVDQCSRWFAGLIPAHAGKTCRHPRGRAPRRAHPRSRGENAAFTALRNVSLGSSPLTRGKRLETDAQLIKLGLILAHAGKTRTRRPLASANPAHPRSRGENAAHPDEVMNALGSSPLTRGKPNRHHLRARRPGLIPAHAGKTPARSLGPGLPWAHPRSRGENGDEVVLVQRDEGSSPLTRGKQPHERGRAKQGGLIPTHAGKTSPPRMRRAAPWAHPHSRGENWRRRRPRLCLAGSSPLTRGKPVHIWNIARAQGLIPTHAGKTYAGEDVIFAPRAHPHSRGENAGVAGRVANERGSSPLTRGKRCLVIPPGCRCRLIPTHAGKTLIITCK